MRRLATVLLLLFGGAASAQQYVYPVPWPKSGGGMLVAVPLATANVAIFRSVGAPHLSAFDIPFPLGAPEQLLTQVPAGEPIILFAPRVGTVSSADEDHIFLIASNQRLVLSIADDERLQNGSPDRIFFMPATSGSFRGRTFYGGVNGGDPGERIRITNFGAVASTVTISAWVSGAWLTQGTISVPPGTDADFDPPVSEAPYRVESTEDAMVVVGYLVDNATMPAADEVSGMPVGTSLFGYGGAYSLRAVTALSYVVETRAPGTTAWAQRGQGMLAADQVAEASLSPLESYIRIRITGGVGWAIVGTPSLMQATEWNGYYLPAQSTGYCTVGQKFFTNSAARTITMLPNPGTTVKIYDEATGVLKGSYVSRGPWEFHNHFHTARARVEFSGGPGAVLLVGTLNWGGCDEMAMPGSCGILEGGYSLPGLAFFRCGVGGTSIEGCMEVANGGCLSTVDGGIVDVDAGIEPDSGVIEVDAGVAMDAGTGVDAGTPRSDAGVAAADAGQPGVPDGGSAGSSHATMTSCGCSSSEAVGLLLLVLAVVAPRTRTRTRSRGQADT